MATMRDISADEMRSRAGHKRPTCRKIYTKIQQQQQLLQLLQLARSTGALLRLSSIPKTFLFTASGLSTASREEAETRSNTCFVLAGEVWDVEHHLVRWP